MNTQNSYCGQLSYLKTHASNRSRKYSDWLVSLVFICVFWNSTPISAAVAPPLGSAQSFAVLGASAVTNTGLSIITGDLGIWPNTVSSVTGFGPGIVIGTTHFADPVALAAQSDATTAYNNLAGQPCGTTISADLGGMSLIPGVYCSGSTMGLTGTLTLDAQGDSNAVFVFQVGSALTTASNSMVNVINGGQNYNVFWQIGSSATLGTGTNFVGNLIAFSSITLTTGSSANGRFLARTGAVTMDNNAISLTNLAPPPALIPPPTLSKAFSPATINANGISTLTVTLSNPSNTIAILSNPLIDTLPSGLVIAASPNVATSCSGIGSLVAVGGSSSVTLPSGRSIPANSSCTLTVDVTAANGGSYINTLLASALVTSNGNNSAPAVATLTVVNPLIQGPPTLGKAFSPATINANGISTLTVTLNNSSNIAATLSNPLVDTLPSGVVIATSPNVATNCSGIGAPIAAAGSSSVTLPSGRSIPANSSCTLTVDVTAANGGSYINTLLAGALVTGNGANPAPAVASLTVLALIVVPSVPPTVISSSVSVPTLSEWTMIMLAVLLALASFVALNRRA